jgi:hypothetical protein
MTWQVVMLAAYGIPTGIHFGGLPFTVGARTSNGRIYADSGVNPSNDIYLDFMYSLIPWAMWMRSSLMSLFQGPHSAWTLHCVCETLLTCAMCCVWHRSLFHAHAMIERAVRDPHRTRGRLAMLPARMAVVVALNLAMAHWMASIWESFANNRGWAFNSYMFDGSLLTDCLMQSARNASCVSSDHLAHGAVNPAYTYDSTTPYSSTWQTSSSYGPWGTALDLPGWSVVASDPNFYDIPGIA